MLGVGIAAEKLSRAANWKARGPPDPKIGLTRPVGWPNVSPHQDAALPPLQSTCWLRGIAGSMSGITVAPLTTDLMTPTGSVTFPFVVVVARPKAFNVPLKP